MLRGHQPSVDLRLTEAEPPEALRMLRAGYVDVALVFRYSPDASGPDLPGPGTAESSESPAPHGGPAGHGSGAVRGSAAAHGNAAAHGSPAGSAGGTGGGASAAAVFGGAGFADDEDGGIDITEGLRERLLLEEPVHLVTSAHGTEQLLPNLSRYARHRWIAGCDRCRANLLRQCALAGFVPKIAFTTDDYVAVQALVAADLGVSTLPALCLRAARHPGVKTVPLAGARRQVLAVRYGDPPDPPAVSLLVDVLRAAADPPPRAHGVLANPGAYGDGGARPESPGSLGPPGPPG
jgi:DNA-binding transcriptional LysR family regulator